MNRTGGHTGSLSSVLFHVLVSLGLDYLPTGSSYCSWVPLWRSAFSHVLHLLPPATACRCAVYHTPSASLRALPASFLGYGWNLYVGVLRCFSLTLVIPLLLLSVRSGLYILSSTRYSSYLLLFIYLLVCTTGLFGFAICLPAVLLHGSCSAVPVDLFTSSPWVRYLLHTTVCAAPGLRRRNPRALTACLSTRPHCCPSLRRASPCHCIAPHCACLRARTSHRALARTREKAANINTTHRARRRQESLAQAGQALRIGIRPRAGRHMASSHQASLRAKPSQTSHLHHHGVPRQPAACRGHFRAPMLSGARRLSRWRPTGLLPLVVLAARACWRCNHLRALATLASRL